MRELCMANVNLRNYPKVYCLIKIAKKILVAKYPKSVAAVHLKI